MAEFIEIIKKDSKVQNKISQTIDKYSKESFSTRSQIGQNALIQSKVFKQAINIMSETIQRGHIYFVEKGTLRSLIKRDQ